jgi:hypothetical protein
MREEMQMRQQGALDLRAVDEALRLADIPGEIMARKGAGLGAPELALHRAILRAFPALGGPPTPAWLRQTAAALGLDPASALAALHERDLVRRDPATGAITCAYPFSGVPTAHRVELAGARPVHAMCAVDALGVPFMFGRDARISSVDPLSGTPVRIEVRAGEAHWEPAEAAVFVGKACREGPSAEACCSVINFFRSAAAAEAFRRAHPELPGRVLAGAEAVEAGRRVFGAVLGEQGPPERRS